MIPGATAELIEQARRRPADAGVELRQVVVDAFIPDTHRLTEMDRARFLDILGKLIFTLEMDVRLNLVDALAATGAPGSSRNIEIEHYLADEQNELVRGDLVAHPAVRQPELLALVKTRLDEFQLADGLRLQAKSSASAASETDVIEGLLRHSDGPIARRAMEYLVAETKRTDRFDEPVISRQDLPISISERLHWQIAAVLRSAMRRNFAMPVARLDVALENAVRRACVQTDLAHGAQARAARLAQQLHDAKDVSDGFLLRCVRQSRLLLLCAGLAARGGMTVAAVWPLLLDRSLVSLVLLLRGVGVAREASSAIISAFSDAYQLRGHQLTSSVGELMAHFELADAEALSDLLHVWRREGAYQEALIELAGQHG